jgi:hypothetical protein
MSAKGSRDIALGIAAAIGTLILVGGALSLLLSPSMPLNTAVFFVAALAGTWVARRNFVTPAVCLAIGLWLLTVYIVYSIAAVADQGDFLDIATRNVLFLLPGLIGAAAGALLGQHFFRHRGEQ